MQVLGEGGVQDRAAASVSGQAEHRARPGRASGLPGLTLAEVVIGGLIVAMTLPAIVSSMSTIRQMEASHVQRSHSSNIAQVVMENIHYRLYNGHRTNPSVPDTLTDSRGYKLNDTQAEREIKYTNKSYLSFFAGLGEAGASVIEPPPGSTSSPVQSKYFDRLILERGDKEKPKRLGQATNPELSTSLKNHLIDVTVSLSQDEPATKDPAEPEIDMARIDVRISWPTFRGAQLVREFHTRYSRTIYEDDPLRRKRP